MIAQQGVASKFSGVAAVQSDEEVIVEGEAGSGEEFMLGSAQPEALPRSVTDSVADLVGCAASKLGPCRVEWAFDGQSVWAVQLHQGSLPSSGRTVFPGAPSIEHRFQVEDGLEALRTLVAKVGGTGEGIVVLGDVGVTSHFGDVLRRARIPSRIHPIGEVTRPR